MSFFRKLLGIFGQPSIMMIAGLFLAIASAYELQETLFNFSEGLEGEHGTFLYGIMVVMRSLAEMEEGMIVVRESPEARDARSEKSDG